jgi:hypothetical protein
VEEREIGEHIQWANLYGILQREQATVVGN